MSGTSHTVKTRTYHLVCFFVLLATLGVPESMPCQAALLTAQVQSSTRQAAQLQAAQPHAPASAQITATPVATTSAAPVWQTTLPPARTAALQAHTTRA